MAASWANSHKAKAEAQYNGHNRKPGRRAWTKQKGWRGRRRLHARSLKELAEDWR